MGHGLGHGVGLDIHEEPVLSPRNPEPLVEGNVVTVEPGIYLPGKFGMRLEDFGVVTDYHALTGLEHRRARHRMGVRPVSTRGHDGGEGQADTVTLAEYRALQKAFPADFPIGETDGVVRRLRSVKERYEVARMRGAQSITDGAFAHIVEFMRPGMTEREVQLELDEFMLRHGAEGLAFAPTYSAADGEPFHWRATKLAWLSRVSSTRMGVRRAACSQALARASLSHGGTRYLEHPLAHRLRRGLRRRGRPCPVCGPRPRGAAYISSARR